MLFLSIFTIMLLLFFGLVNPLLKKHNLKLKQMRSWPVFDILGGLVDFLRF